MKLSEYRAAHPLASAVHSQLGRPPVSELLDTLRDVSGHGADSGFPGFTYYTDTVSFAKRHRVTILESLREFASDMGDRDPVALVLGFRCVKQAEVSPEAVWFALYGSLDPYWIPQGVSENDVDAVLNGLAWYALESVAHIVSDR
jgi:hypothetical protein